MGTEALWIPVVMAAVGAGTSYVNQRSMRKKADRVALESLRTNKDRQKKADAVTQKLIADTGASTNAEEKKSTMDGFMQQLLKARGDAHSGVQPVGGASDAFARDAASAALGIDKQGGEYADLAARLDSPFLQRRGENRMMADAGLNLGLVGREQEGEDRVRNLRLQGIRSNPWLEALSAVAGGAASAYAGGAGGGSTGQPATAFGYQSFGG